MKRSIVIAMVLACLPAVLTAAGSGQINVTTNCRSGDTVDVGIPISLQFHIANDVVMGQFQIPIMLSSPDGVTWTWNAQPDGWGTHKYVTHTPGSRIDPPVGLLDMTGGLAVLENLPNGICLAGAANASPGVAPGPLEKMLSIHITASIPDIGTHQLCIDLTQTVGMCTFALADLSGLDMDVDFLDSNGDGKWCIPVVDWDCKSSANHNRDADASLSSIDCGPSMTAVPFGVVYEQTVVADNPMEGCGIPLRYGIMHTTDMLYHAKQPVNAPSIDAVSGLFQWLPTEADTGLWMFTVGATTAGDPAECAFVLIPYSCGDANGDGKITSGDPIYIISHIFRGGPAPVPLGAADANCDDKINSGDAVYIVSYIFRGGPPPCCP